MFKAGAASAPLCPGIPPEDGYIFDRQLKGDPAVAEQGEDNQEFRQEKE